MTPRAALVLAALLAAACRHALERDSVGIVLPNEVLSLDPNAVLEQSTDAVLANVFEPLVGFDANLRLEPVLAESWEQPSPERWRFRLRKGVRFHDGTALTAALAREALLAVQRDPQLEASQFLSAVREIAAPGELTLDIVTVEPRAILASLPFVYLAKPNAAGGFPPLLGTGPYRLRRWEPGVRLEVERFDGYRGPPPVVREAVFFPAPSRGDPLALLIQGTADIAYQLEPHGAANAPANVRIVRQPGLTVFYIGLDVRARPGNPLQDPRVRRALHLALDREQLVREVYKGMARVASQPVAPLVFGYNTQLAEPRRALDAARRLLAEAGHARGLRTRLDISSARLDVARLIAEQLHEAGVELTVNGLPGGEVDRVAGKSPLFFLGWDCSTGEASEIYEFLLHTPTERYGRGNYGGYSNPLIDRIAETNAALLDPMERRRLLEKAAVLVMEELPMLPLFVTDSVHGVRAGLHFRPRADNQVRLTSVSFE